ncbi:MAG: hypothetical protein ABIG68_01935 [Acidobacteriota bacterium]
MAGVKVNQKAQYPRLTAILAAVVWIAGCSGNREAAAPDPAASLAPMRAHDPAARPAAGAPNAPLQFSAPADWVAETPASSMRQAQYRLPRVVGDLEDAELVVFFFQGQGGSVEANIERWIAQFARPDGSPPSDAARTERHQVNGIPITIVEVSGTYMASSGPMLSEVQAKPQFRMLAAVAEAAGGPWFFKLTGPEKTIARWEKSFFTFLDTLRQ